MSALTTALATDKQRHTIFKSIATMSLQETELEREAARQYLISIGDIEDRDYQDDELIREGCSHCRKTYNNLIQDELNYRESCQYDTERMNLDKKLSGTLYAIIDLGRWNGRHRAFKRLTRRDIDKKTGNTYPVDNLDRSISSSQRPPRLQIRSPRNCRLPLYGCER
jgi:hypothetical protein